MNWKINFVLMMQVWKKNVSEQQKMYGTLRALGALEFRTQDSEPGGGQRLLMPVMGLMS